jgi:hypothetical protein
MTTALAATDKQIAFAEKLMSEKQHNLTELPTGRKDVSNIIDWLLRQPAKPKAQASGQALTPGVYQAPDGSLIKVQQSRGSSNVYAKVMTDFSGKRLTMTGEVVQWEWTYAPGLITHVTSSMKLDTIAAMDFGLRYGQCMWCGRKLKDAKSVMQSLGPVCAKKFM